MASLYRRCLAAGASRRAKQAFGGWGGAGLPNPIRNYGSAPGPGISVPAPPTIPTPITPSEHASVQLPAATAQPAGGGPRLPATVLPVPAPARPTTAMPTRFHDLINAAHGFRNGQAPQGDWSNLVANAYHNSPEPLRGSFDHLAAHTGLGYDDLFRGLAAEQAMLEQAPDPANPNQQQLLSHYNQMPPEWQRALREWQSYQIINHSDYGGAELTADRDNPNFRHGFQNGVPRHFVFPPVSPPAAGAAGPLPAHEYRNMHELATMHGIDLRSPEFQEWWRNHPTMPEDNPGRLLQLYSREQEQRNNTDYQQRMGPTRFAGNMVGTQRQDPLTGQNNYRSRDQIQQGRSLLGSAGRSVVSINPYAVGGSLATAGATGSTSPTSGLAYDMAALPNYLMGMDLFGNIDNNPTGTPTPGEGNRSFLFGTDQRSSVLNELARDRRLAANAPDAGYASRVGNNVLAQIYDRLPMAAAANTLASPVGAGGTLPLVTPTRNFINSVGTLGVNPVIAGAEHGIRQFPLGEDDTVDANLRRRAQWSRENLPGGRAIGAVLEDAPALAAMLAGGLGQAGTSQVLQRQGLGRAGLPPGHAARLPWRSEMALTGLAAGGAGLAGHLSDAPRDPAMSVGTGTEQRRTLYQRLRSSGLNGNIAESLSRNTPLSPESREALASAPDDVRSNMLADLLREHPGTLSGVAAPPAQALHRALTGLDTREQSRPGMPRSSELSWEANPDVSHWLEQTTSSIYNDLLAMRDQLAAHERSQPLMRSEWQSFMSDDRLRQIAAQKAREQLLTQANNPPPP